MKLSVLYVETFALACVGLSLRAIVSMHSYSGKSKPPMFGDYEAQRHWQEITINLPISEWYKNSTHNDLMYWGLDYPPLTAYHSYLLGVIARTHNKSFVSLKESRGLETEAHKSFMRLTVLAADLFIYIPALVVLGSALKTTFNIDTLPFLILALLYPGQILIDNGHFQYNNISLGLAAFAMTFILRNRYYMATLFFTFALNYKQMELYHALPFFTILLRLCFEQKSYLSTIGKLCKIGSIVLLTFLVLWVPWLNSLDGLKSVLTRLFPVNRGVFEDIVANIWCAINVVYKIKYKLSNQQLIWHCFSITIIAVLPQNVLLFIKKTKLNFILSLISSAGAFFLFSFQVHEKSILLVALPAFCLFALKPHETFLFLEVSIFSMFPLLIKDRLILAYFATFCIYYIIVKMIYLQNVCKTKKKTLFSYFWFLTEIVMIILTFATILAPVPGRYPYIWSLFIALFSCVYFVLYFLFINLYDFLNPKQKLKKNQ